MLRVDHHSEYREASSLAWVKDGDTYRAVSGRGLSYEVVLDTDFEGDTKNWDVFVVRENGSRSPLDKNGNEISRKRGIYGTLAQAQAACVKHEAREGQYEEARSAPISAILKKLSPTAKAMILEGVETGTRSGISGGWSSADASARTRAIVPLQKMGIFRNWAITDFGLQVGEALQAGMKARVALRFLGHQL